jgi:hypothetical protein
MHIATISSNRGAPQSLPPQQATIIRLRIVCDPI